MNGFNKTSAGLAFAVALSMVGIMAASRPALAEDGCGPWEPTVCQSSSYWYCVQGECGWMVIETFGKREGEVE